MEHGVDIIAEKLSHWRNFFCTTTQSAQRKVSVFFVPFVVNSAFGCKLRL